MHDGVMPVSGQQELAAARASLTICQALLHTADWGCLEQGAWGIALAAWACWKPGCSGQILR